MDMTCSGRMPRMERHSYEIRVRDGQIAEEEELGMRMMGVYGGVDLNLDGFDLSEAADIDESMLPPEPIDLEKLTLEELKQMVLDAGGALPPPPITREKLYALIMELYPQVGGPFDFWEAIGFEEWPADAGPPPFSEEDRRMLRAAFNPALADRQDDGDRFVPPSCSRAYLDKLRKLVAEEARVQHRRREHFLSQGFDVGDAGPLFPHSWRSFFTVACGQAKGRDPNDAARARPRRTGADAAAEAEEVRRTAEPAFCKRAEDGTVYRVYRRGELEVRTLQAWDAECDAVAATFRLGDTEGAGAPRPEPRGSFRREPREQEQVARVTELVEPAPPGLWPCYCAFVVLETERGARIATRMLGDGTVTWEEGPEDLAARESSARVRRTAACSGATVRAMREHHLALSRGGESECKATLLERNRYARGAYRKASTGA